MELRFRQVHLDFHTSGLIPDIGADFDPREFADTLAAADVDSITCFARCHHGYLYYDSKKFPERIHPHLARPNLLLEQIEACHQRGIRVPIYITVQWDEFTAKEHPEWLVMDEQGTIRGTKPFEAGFYRFLALNSPYVDFLKEQTQEVLETMPVDGIFFDIVDAREDNSKWSMEGMLALGMDPSDHAQRLAYGVKVVNDFKTEMTAFVRRFNQDCTIFYNAGNIGPLEAMTADAYSHFELESLPSGGWGYMHFPVSAAYARKLGKDCMGMTGKFHTSWGDFHSFKTQAALRFECMRMLAMNAKCSIGDQLLPNGKICEHTYDLIGSVYSEVKAKEAWCAGAGVKSEIAVLTSEEFTFERTPADTSGALRLLMEGHYQFDVVDTRMDLAGYRLVILPDEITVDEAFAVKLERFLAGGGALIASYHSGMDAERTRFNLRTLGVSYQGEAPYSPDFLVPQGEIGAGLPQTEHVMYLRGAEVAAQPDSEVLAPSAVPYFNRTWEHFISHRHTPSRGETGYPGIVRNGNAIYFMHPIFRQYEQNAPRWVRMLFFNAIDLLMPDPLVRVDGPTTLLATLNTQTEKQRDIVHLLHFIPERRGRDFDVVEEVIPLYHLPVSVRVEQQVQSVRLVPQEVSLDFKVENGRVSFEVDKLDGHQMIEIQY
ncbi:MAG: beta-galactosidase trimerization domain-containing protein [Anaerolineaceae bacterium]|nr:beta-galactosidase trimerization domain-containing protein [Anaerolineaceae bacterium]